MVIIFILVENKPHGDFSLKKEARITKIAIDAMGIFV